MSPTCDTDDIDSQATLRVSGPTSYRRLRLMKTMARGHQESMRRSLHNASCCRFVAPRRR